MRPVTPLIRIEEKRVEWRAMQRDLPAATVAWINSLLADVGTLVDSTRMVSTILGCGDGVYSETVERQMAEIKVRQQFRRSA